MFRELAISELEAKGIRTRAGTKSGEIFVCCPFCELRGKGPDTGYHLGLNTYDGRAHCFRCEYRSQNGMEQLGVIDFQISAAPTKKKVKTKVALPEDFALLAPDKSDYWMWKAWQYVRKRGMSQLQIRKHGVGLSLMGPQRYRVVFPVRDPNGKLVGYTGRSIIDREPSWLHMADMEGMFLAQFGTRRRVTLVEGIFDSLAIEKGLGEVTDVVAILGTHIRVTEWLKQYNRVVIWLDPDSAGQTAAVEMAESMSWNPQVKVVRSKLEPSDCNYQQLISAWNKRQPWSWNEGLRLLAGDRYDAV